MHRKTLAIVLGVIAVVIVVVAVGVFAMSKAPKQPQASPNAPVKAFDFTLKDINGKSHTLSDYQGKFVFLNFWASWCPPCRNEMPSMQTLYEEADRKQFVILAVNAKQERDTVRAFVEENEYTYPILLDTNYKVSGRYRVRAIPVTYLINKEGYIVGRVVGGREWKWEDIEPLLNK